MGYWSSCGQSLFCYRPLSLAKLNVQMVFKDGCDCKDIELVDRGNKGSGQGLSASNSVVWNSRGWRKVNVDSTPLSTNFAVGCTQNGQQAPSTGQVISFGEHVRPFGLFAEQLMQRIGRDAAEQVLGMRI